MIFQTALPFWQGKQVLDTELLEQLRANAALYDREQRFCHEDIELLQAKGYFKAQLAAAQGGADLTLSEIAAEQARLAAAAPATALAVNMHQIIIAMAKHMLRSQEPDKMTAAKKILNLAAADAIFAFGISEPSNDRVLFASTCEVKDAEDGNFTFSGKKVFMSLAPVATHTVIYGMLDTASSLQKYAQPQSLFAVAPMQRAGLSLLEDWDVLGMRATGSYSANFDNYLLHADDVLTVTPTGPSFDPVVFGIFATFELLLAATYYGLADRVLSVGIDSVRTRKSLLLNKNMNNDPLIRRRVAVAALQLAGLDLELASLCEIFENFYSSDSAVQGRQVLGKFWLPLLSAIKNKASEAAFKVSEEMMRSVGGRSYYNTHELSRLYRDVLAGLFQPSDQESLQNAWANIILGPIEQ